MFLAVFLILAHTSVVVSSMPRIQHHTFYPLLFILGNKKLSWLALVFGVLMGISRIYLVVHFPSDVLAGLITGTIAGMLGTLIAINLPRKWYLWSFSKKERDASCSDLAN